MNGGQILAIFLCGVLVIIAICAAWFILDARASLRERPHGRHAHVPFAHPDAAADQYGEVTQAWARSLHHAELPVAGCLAVAPVADTAPQPVIKDVIRCELGTSSTQDYVDGVFAPAEASLNAMAARYAEVTG